MSPQSEGKRVNLVRFRLTHVKTGKMSTCLVSVSPLPKRAPMCYGHSVSVLIPRTLEESCTVRKDVVGRSRWWRHSPLRIASRWIRAWTEDSTPCHLTSSIKIYRKWLGHYSKVTSATLYATTQHDTVELIPTLEVKDLRGGTTQRPNLNRFSLGTRS